VRRRLIAVGVAAGVVAATAAWITTAGAETSRGAPAATLSWHPCKMPEGWPPDRPLPECTTLKVPLNHANPGGPTINLEVSRVKATGTAAERRGILLVNPGGPGGTGVEFASTMAFGLQNATPSVRKAYDVIGFDPRGVGQSSGFNCVDPADWYKAPRPDYVPLNAAEERVHLARAKEYATGCRQNAAALLPHMKTPDAVKDMDLIRTALGEKKISYYGYSYGTYLGAVYGTLFPKRVDRMVLDSIVRPSGVWYESQLDQDRQFDKVLNLYFDWIADHDAVYHLGTSGATVRDKFYAARKKLRDQPAKGVVGPSEWDDIFTTAGYTTAAWPAFAPAFSAYVNNGDEQAVADLFGPTDAAGENGFAVYNAVQCSDAPWPKSWAKWHRDAVRVYKEAPFLAWSNTWFNAACHYWPVRSANPVEITGKGLPPVLLLQATQDAATPLRGGLEMRRRLANSRLVVENGGITHGIGVGGTTCLDGKIDAYLGTGELPRDTVRGPADATCAPPPLPEPASATAAAAMAKRMSNNSTADDARPAPAPPLVGPRH
jgi:pimeloyl-ACP methyl ester carboxylesterase